MNKLAISGLVIAAISLGNAGSTLYLPALPLMTEALHTSKATMQLTLSYFLLGFSLSQLLYGPLSDAFGRKINLLIGLMIFILGTLLCFFAEGAAVFIIGRLIQGFGIGAASAVGYALMRDVYEGHKLTQQLSYMSIFVGMMPLIAPLIGGYIVQYFSFRTCFTLLALLASILFGLKYKYLPETLITKIPNAHHPKVMFRNYLLLLKNTTCRSSILIVALAFSSILTMASMLPFLVIAELKFSPSIYGWIAGIPAASYLLGAFCMSRAGHLFTLVQVVLLGLILGILAMSLGIFWNLDHFTLYSTLLPLFVFMFGVGCIVPKASSAALAPFPKLAGSAAALLCSLMFAVSFCATSVGATLNPATPLSLFYLLLTTSVLNFFILLTNKTI